MSMGLATNWAGNVTFDATRVHRPDSFDKLKRLVGASPRIRALGTGHSFSDIAATSGDLVRLDQIPGRVEIGPGGRTATVHAAMTYSDVADVLHRAGFALANMASLPHISIAGSCATGTHGSGHAQQGLAAAARAVRVVDPDGDPVELSRSADPDTFPGAVVALGALGVVTSLVLDIEPSYQVAQEVRVAVPLDEVEQDWAEVFGAAYSVSVFTDYASGAANVWLKYRTDRARSRWSGGRAAERPLHPVPGMPPGFCTTQQGVPGPWHHRLPHFRPDFVPSSGRELQSEYFIARESGPAAMAALRAISGRFAPALQIAEVRTVCADDLWLSPAYGRDSATFHFTWTDDPAVVLPAIRAVERELLPLDARPHWSKLKAAPPAEIISRYPRQADFARLLRALDPRGKFRNRLVDDLFPPVP